MFRYKVSFQVNPDIEVNVVVVTRSENDLEIVNIARKKVTESFLGRVRGATSVTLLEKVR